jgi:transposase
MSHTAEDSQDHRSDEEIILGVDTHKDTHVASVITILGVLVATATFPTTAAGYRELLGWARSFGVLCRAGVEGTGSYGAAFARYLRRQDIAVIEVNRPDRAARRHGKADTVDATAVAHAELSARATTTAKTGHGPAEMLRMFRLTRASAVKSRTQAIKQLKAAIIGADPALRDTPNGLIRRQPASGVPD